MAANKIIRFGPAYLSNSVANILNCNVTSLAGPVGFTMTQPYLILRHLRLVNKTGSAVTATLYVGATGASAGGTEVITGPATSIAGLGYLEWYGWMRLDVADFLTGVAGSASAIVIQGEAEIGLI